MSEPKVFLSTFDRDGWVEYHKTVRAKNRSKLSMVAVFGFFLGLSVFFVVGLLKWTASESWGALTVGLFFSVIITAIMSDVIKSNQRKVMDFEASRPAPRTCTITDEYFEVSEPGGIRTQMPWSAMKLKEKTPTAIVVDAGTFMPFAIMRSNLQRAGLEEEFLSRIGPSSAMPRQP